jgi:hypothetical protein
MARSISSTILAAANSQTTTEVFLALLDFSHSDLAGNIRIVNNTENVTSNSNVYTAAPFSLSLPPEGAEANPVMRVSTTNVDRSIIDDIRSVAGGSERIACDVTIIATSAPDTALASYVGFEMVNVQYTAEDLTFDLSVENFLTEPFPYGSFTPTTTPGIF